MKNISIILLAAICSSVIFSCKESPEAAKKKSIDLMTTQTLGLAYLEEFKLNEAEKEFLKYIKLAPKKNLDMQTLALPI